MTENTMLKTGIIGTLIAAVCCFSPVLVILFGFAGLSAFVGGLDYALFPILFASLGLVAYALYLRSGRKGPSPTPAIVIIAVGLSALLFWLEFKYATRISFATAVSVAIYAFYLRGGRHQNDTSTTASN